MSAKRRNVRRNRTGRPQPSIAIPVSLRVYCKCDVHVSGSPDHAGIFHVFTGELAKRTKPSSIKLKPYFEVGRSRY